MRNLFASAFILTTTFLASAVCQENDCAPIQSSETSSFPNYTGKWNKPSLMTPEKSLRYHQSHNLLPSYPPPQTIIFCYSKGLMKRVLENYPMRQCDGKLNSLYFFADHPNVAIVYYGAGAPSNAMRLE